MNNKELQKILDMLPEDFTFKAVYEKKYEKELTQQEENPTELIVEQEEIDKLVAEYKEYLEEQEIIKEYEKYKKEREWEMLYKECLDLLTEAGIKLPEKMIEKARYFESWGALE
ncbi:hypothetical protein OQH61_04285 [Helicobacter sp. MIT 21-1697]|uniref:hypothetical protein n=1 Tax=Helicobacter sp. MIT 21-1697 TaxID=2993733 RepID=UPI00224B362F|nr:hypothetical protein [Helicobacter sp. MIT 21-1697]MCX2716950.1 hypothetical protein [Helicobacter sp. MIT 21-1697]